ncbi:hypothetical protein [uncultured Treponema sp.]|mgnify:FL=1|uniref:hypothetical protein n=1 Tax=uncultured Treponema sp. TaxID=162155 RepID=UPI002584C0A6|nr:hypothetical protein [uncultured Treponema sp.]
MALIQNFSNQKTENQLDKNTKAEEKPDARMITIPQAEAEKYLIALAETLDDVQDLKEVANSLITSKNSELEHFRDDTITKFNALIESTTELKEKLDTAESYENYLEERVKNANLSAEVAALEKQLQKEKMEVSIFIQTMTRSMDTCTAEIHAKITELKSADEIIKDSIKEFKDETEKATTSYLNEAEKKIAEVSTTLLANSKNEYEILKTQSSDMIKAYTEKCQAHLETIKKQSIDFLKQCAAENKKLVESVPSVKNRKLSVKDMIIYSLSIMAIAATFFQLAFR